MHNDKITPKEVEIMLLNFGNQYICQLGIICERGVTVGSNNAYRNIISLQFTIVDRDRRFKKAILYPWPVIS